MVPDDRIVVVFVQPLQVGDRFSDWPLHITIVPWFRTTKSNVGLTKEITEHIINVKPFTAIIGREAHFGFQKQKLVNLIELPTQLIELESQIRTVLHRNNAWIVDETTKRKRPYQPHITAQHSARVKEGDRLPIDKLALVSQKGSFKQLEEIIPLK